eukprot:scaffold655_cov105-Isochrysis_galbana.AAC.13
MQPGAEDVLGGDGHSQRQRRLLARAKEGLLRGNIGGLLPCSRAGLPLRYSARLVVKGAGDVEDVPRREGGREDGWGHEATVGGKEDLTPLAALAGDRIPKTVRCLVVWRGALRLPGHPGERKEEGQARLNDEDGVGVLVRRRGYFESRRREVEVHLGRRGRGSS